MSGEQLVSPWRACKKRCNPVDQDVLAELQGRAEESCANCSWTRNSGLAITILLFNANEFLGSLFYSNLAFIQAERDSERQVQTGRCWGPADGQLSYFGANSQLFLPGSTAKAAQALPLTQLISSEEANPPSRGRGTSLSGTVCF